MQPAAHVLAKKCLSCRLLLFFFRSFSYSPCELTWRYLVHFAFCPSHCLLYFNKIRSYIWYETRLLMSILNQILGGQRRFLRSRISPYFQTKCFLKLQSTLAYDITYFKCSSNNNRRFDLQLTCMSPSHLSKYPELRSHGFHVSTEVRPVTYNSKHTYQIHDAFLLRLFCRDWPQPS